MALARQLKDLVAAAGEVAGRSDRISMQQQLWVPCFTEESSAIPEVHVETARPCCQCSEMRAESVAALAGVGVIAGPIPPELGDLAAVTDVWLNDNQLSGEPSALARSSRVQSQDDDVPATAARFGDDDRCSR